MMLAVVVYLPVEFRQQEVRKELGKEIADSYTSVLSVREQ